MARVAFFIENLPPTDDLIARFAFNLARALAEQQHELLVLSTARPGHPGPRPQRGIQIGFPFRGWSWIEAARAVPALLSFRPEVLHFVQPHAEALDGWTNAMTALPTIARSAALGSGAPIPAIVASFFDLRGEWKRGARGLLAQADAVTAANESQLAALGAELAPGARPLLAATPLGFVEEEAGGGDSAHDDGALAALRARVDEIVLAPGDVDAHGEPARLFQLAARILERRPRAAFAISGGWGRTSPLERFELLRALGAGADRFALLGARGPEARARAFAASALAFAPTLAHGSLELAESAREALKQSTFWLATEEHLASDSVGPRTASWRAAAPDDDDALVEAAVRALEGAPARSAQTRSESDGARRELADSPANVVSRLYARALVERRRWP